MSREVRHDGSGLLQVRFPFDRTLVDLIKTLPNRRWHAAERFWSVPERDVVVLVDTLEPRAFRFDEATCDAYRAMGGSLPIDGKALDAAGPTLPGLFVGLSAAADGLNRLYYGHRYDDVRTFPVAGGRLIALEDTNAATLSSSSFANMPGRMLSATTIDPAGMPVTWLRTPTRHSMTRCTDSSTESSVVSRTSSGFSGSS